MCGIAGIWTAKNKAVELERPLSQMLHILRHRGPNASEIKIFNGGGFGHARLSIIDVGNISNQPMIDATTENIIVFNGEIYNYLELKAELELQGYAFRTKSDTEVILKAYSAWGVECLNRFNGMWAFSLYDRQNQVFFAARDRMGIKPFVYCMNKEKDLIFASEAKAIIGVYPEFKTANEEFLLNFVNSDFFACYKNTFYREVVNLLPGHYFVVRQGEVPEQKRYWNWLPSTQRTDLNDESAVEGFRNILEDSIRLRFRSDVPVGSCLSGGIDSGVIVGLSTKNIDKPLHTFSCIYPNHPNFDESYYIRESVKKFGTIASYVEPNYNNYLDEIKASIYEQDGPTGGASILSQRAVMQLAGQHVRVVLDGQGADELLGGYHSYFRYSLQTQFREFRQEKSLKKLISYLDSSRKIKKRIGKKIGGFAQYLYLTNSPVKFYSNALEGQLGFFEEYESDDLSTLLLEHVFTNLTNLLHYEDRNSMRFSVEARLPYLDYRLVEYAFSLPHNFKIRKDTTKWLLNRIAKDVLPSVVYERKDKMGYTTPAHTWLRQEHNIKPLGAYFKNTPMFNALTKDLQTILKGCYNALALGNSLTLEQNNYMNVFWRHINASIWMDSLSA